ncbi:hypothetical protein ACFLVB_01790 [Chloroflexota bacterium]
MEQLPIPGLTPCPDGVLQAMTRQMTNHPGFVNEAGIENALSAFKVALPKAGFTA